MFRIVPVPLCHDLTLIGKKRGSELPLGLRTMFERAFDVIEMLGLKPTTIVVGDEENFLVRAQNAILQLPDGNAPISSAENLGLLESWASFLRWYSWWSTPHWTHQSFNQGFYAGLCTTCEQYSQSKVQFEKCLRPECPSHAMWATVNGETKS